MLVVAVQVLVVDIFVIGRLAHFFQIVIEVTLLNCGCQSSFHPVFRCVFVSLQATRIKWLVLQDVLVKVIFVLLV